MICLHWNGIGHIWQANSQIMDVLQTEQRFILSSMLEKFNAHIDTYTTERNRKTHRNVWQKSIPSYRTCVFYALFWKTHAAPSNLIWHITSAVRLFFNTIFEHAFISSKLFNNFKRCELFSSFHRYALHISDTLKVKIEPKKDNE